MSSYFQRSNLFVYGTNGCGKTTFAIDCLNSLQQTMPYVYVDCVEYYSEKLISLYISLYLTNMMQKKAMELGVSKGLVKRLNIKSSKNFPQLMDNILAFSNTFNEIKKSEILLSQENFFFYLVLDNISNLITVERTKKILTKLCIIQSLTIPMCFSIMVINSTLWNEISVFKDQQPIFEEHMFLPFIVTPMGEEQVKRIIQDKLYAKYKCEFLDRIYNSYFTLLYNDIRSYTTNINEYEYFFVFLYPYFIAPLKQCQNSNEVEEKLKKPLVDRKFKDFISEVKTSLFMHLTSKEDIQNELQIQDEVQFQNKVSEQQKMVTQIDSSVLGQSEGFDYRKINYFDNHKKNINFSFMQSICLISAYLAGANREGIDQKIFTKSQSRGRKTHLKPTEIKQFNQNLLGKTKKFSSERLFSIIDFLISIEAEGSFEHKALNKTLDYLSCVITFNWLYNLQINSLAEEGLLKKTLVKKNDGTDDLTNIGFKCNFDYNFIVDVCEKIDFKLSEYLMANDHEA